MFPNTLPELLVVPVLTGLVIALFLENTSWWLNLPPDRKAFWGKVLNFGAGILITAIEYFVNPALFQQASGVYAALVPVLNLIFFGTTNMGSAYLGSQATYALGKRYLPDYFQSTGARRNKLQDYAEIANKQKAA